MTEKRKKKSCDPDGEGEVNWETGTLETEMAQGALWTPIVSLCYYARCLANSNSKFICETQRGSSSVNSDARLDERVWDFWVDIYAFIAKT